MNALDLHSKRVHRSNRLAFDAKLTNDHRKAKRAAHILRILFVRLEKLGVARKGSAQSVQRRMKRYVRDTMAFPRHSYTR